MGMILDISLVVLAVLFLIIGARRGIAKSLAEFGGTIVAIVAASLLASVFAGVIYNNFVESSLLNSVTGSLDNTVGQNLAARIEDVYNALPRYIQSAAESYGVTNGNIGGAIGSSTDRAAMSIVNLVSPIVIDLIRTICLVILFIVLMIVVKVAARGIDRIFRLPVLSGINSLLGAVLGLVKCAVLVMLVCFVVQVILPMTGISPGIFSQENIESSTLFKYVYQHNLFEWLFGIFKW